MSYGPDYTDYLKNAQLPIEEAILEAKARAFYLFGCKPEEINNGWCEDFAELLVEIYGGQSVWGDELCQGCSCNHECDCDYFSHCVYESVDGRYYDSNCPQGTDDWRELWEPNPR